MSSDHTEGCPRREPGPGGIGTFAGIAFDLDAIAAALEPGVRTALPAAYNAGLEAGRLLFAMRKDLEAGAVHRKGYADVVTEADYAAERLLVERLTGTPPGCGFLLEEGGQVDGASEWTWVIDPLDGTANYVRGRSIYCCSIALCRGTRPILGVIVAPALGHVYVAAAGGGAWLNGERLRVSEIDDLDQAYLTTGMSAVGPGPVAADPFGAHIRCFGSAAVELADVAAGRSEFHVQTGLKPWDLAAGVLLIVEAGGRVTTPTGQPYALGPDVAAGNDRIHAALLKRLKANLVG